MMSYKMTQLEISAPVLEELNKMSGEYVGFNTLLENTKLEPPALTRRLHFLMVAHYVDKNVVEGPKKKVEQTFKISEYGQKALARYKEITKLMGEIP